MRFIQSGRYSSFIANTQHQCTFAGIGKLPVFLSDFPMRTILCLLISNCFMTYAWYGHLKKDTSNIPLLKLVLLSWAVAFFEYLFMVPANNRFGLKDGFSPFQLKTIQEVISLVIFCLFAVLFLKEPLRWNYIVAFLFIFGAVYFMFYQKPS